MNGHRYSGILVKLIKSDKIKFRILILNSNLIFRHIMKVRNLKEFLEMKQHNLKIPALKINILEEIEPST